MISAGIALADAAADLVGVRFRLHGRDPASGLDCVGLVGAALAATGRSVALPCDYTLKMRSLARFAGLASHLGLCPAERDVCVGDILLLCVGPCQFHMGIVGPKGCFIHAHAGLRRVVQSSLPQGDIVERWRLPASD